MIRKFSAGGIVYKKVRSKNEKVGGNEVLWLIRRAAPNPGFDGNLGWTLPKGLVDEGEETTKAAVREVQEETGVSARIVSKLQPLKYVYTDKELGKVFKVVTYFLMEWETDLPEGFGWETKEIKWVSLDEGLQLLAYPTEKGVLREVMKLLSKSLR
jgi:8-oxo-dGTP pyrophosphatase MutT (NUDIX family)